MTPRRLRATRRVGEQQSLPAAAGVDPTGSVATPPALAAWICRRALAIHATYADERRTSAPLRVLDPAVGDGVFPEQILRALPDATTAARRASAEALELYAMDIQPSVVRHARRRLPDARIAAGNFLLDTPPGPGRYDIIVGNPPYLGQRDVTRLDYATALFDRFGFKDDLYVYFILRCLELLADGGVLAMVTSDSWLTLTGKEPLRRALLEHRLDHVVRLGQRAFDRRITACCFGLIKNRRPGDVWTVEETSYRSSDAVFDPSGGRRTPQSVFARAPGAVIFDPTPENLRLNRALSETWTSRPPGSHSWRPGQIVRFDAVATVKDTGIHSRNCRHLLFFAKKIRPNLQRLLQGVQIERWRVRWDAPSARYRWVDLAYRPKPGVKGSGRGGRPSLRDEYWEFQGDPAIHRLPERILIRQTGDEIVAAYFRQGRRVHYTDNTLFTCLPSERAIAFGLTFRYLLGYLNSAPINRIYRFLSQERARPQAQIKIRLLRALPFRLPTRAAIARIDGIVEQILRAYRRGRPDDAKPLIASCDRHFRATLKAH